MVRRRDLGSRGGVDTTAGQYPTASGGTVDFANGPGGKTTEAYAPGSAENPYYDVTDLFGPIVGRTAKGKNLRQRVVMDRTLLTQLAADPNLPLYYTVTGRQVMFTATRTKGSRGAGRLGDLFGKGVNGRRTVIVTLQHQMMLLGLYGQGSPTYGVWSPDDQQALSILASTVEAQNQTYQMPVVAGSSPVYALGKYLKNNALAVSEELRRQQQWAVSAAAAEPISVTSETSSGNALDQQFKTLVGRLPTASERSRFIAAYRADQIRYGQQYNAASGQDASQQLDREWTAKESAYRQAQVDPFIRYNGQRVPASQVPFQDRERVKKMYPGLDYAAIDEFYRTHPRGGAAPGAGVGSGAVIAQPADLESAAVAAAKASPEYLPNQIGQYGQQILQTLAGGGGPVGALGIQGG